MIRAILPSTPLARLTFASYFRAPIDLIIRPGLLPPMSSRRIFTPRFTSPFTLQFTSHFTSHFTPNFLSRQAQWLVISFLPRQPVRRFTSRSSPSLVLSLMSITGLCFFSAAFMLQRLTLPLPSNLHGIYFISSIRGD
jgi:hypothetical protein